MVHTKSSTPITIERWFDVYRPVPNASGASLGFDVNDKSCLHETSGPDLVAVQAAVKNKPETVWTLLDCDGQMFITNGFHYVNRMGYFITEVPYTNEHPIDIACDDDDGDLVEDDLDEVSQ